VGKVVENLERPLPQSNELERAVLGAILAGHEQRSELLDTIRREDFFTVSHAETPHAALFSLMVGLQAEGIEPDLLAVHDASLRTGQLDKVGGTAYLSSIADGIPLRGDMMQAARRLRQMSVYRQAIHAADAIKELAFEQSASPVAFLDSAIERLSSLARDMASAQDDGMTHFDATGQMLFELGQDSGPKIYTDLDQLDRIVGGFRPGELVIITAETGSGKTLLAQQTRARACRDGFHSLFCSGEMLAPHLKRRELAAVADVAPSKMRREDLLTADDRRALIEAAVHECKKCRILDGELELSRIRRAARKMKKISGLDCLILDYDELIEAPGKDEFDQQRNLVRAIKTLGMELRSAVILISQLRKPLSGEDVAKPTLQRIYGSGSKTKHASIVILADRKYVRELQGDETEAQIFILKNRDGRTGRVKAKFDIRRLRFDDADGDSPDERVWKDHTQPRGAED
jgi:replicative DNA helicase